MKQALIHVLQVTQDEIEHRKVQYNKIFCFISIPIPSVLIVHGDYLTRSGLIPHFLFLPSRILLSCTELILC